MRSKGKLLLWPGFITVAVLLCQVLQELPLGTL